MYCNGPLLYMAVCCEGKKSGPGRKIEPLSGFPDKYNLVLPASGVLRAGTPEAVAYISEV